MPVVSKSFQASDARRPCVPRVVSGWIALSPQTQVDAAITEVDVAVRYHPVNTGAFHFRTLVEDKLNLYLSRLSSLQSP